MPFRGRVHGKVLGPGTYTIVRQSSAGSRRPKTVAVTIDARGIRPSTPVRWRNCSQAAAADAAVPASMSGTALLRSAPSRSDVAAAESAMPPTTGAKGHVRAAKHLAAAAGGLLPSVRRSPLLTALLIGQLAFSLALLALATLGSADATARLRPRQVLVRHRPQIAIVGGLLLVGTAILYLLAHVTS